MTTLWALIRQSLAALRVLVAATVLLGVLYPLTVWGAAHALAPWRAEGSLVTADGERTRDAGEAVGSALLGQAVDDPALFHPRPSAAGDGYDALASGASNLGPESPELVALIEQRRAEVAEREDAAASAVPPDALTASASGLDPHISPAYAYLQAPRVARESGLGLPRVRELVEEHTAGRTLGVLGEERVDVLALDIAVRAAMRAAPQG